MNVAEALTAARDLVARPGGWTTGQFRDTKTGAVCALGAINEVAASNRALHIWCAAALVDVLPWPQDIAHYNDHSTQAEVVALFDRAIAEVRAGDRQAVTS